jgi:hypothetical protein
MKENTLQITCPECGHQFSPERVIEGHLRIHLEKEYSEKMTTNSKLIEEKAKALAHAEFAAKVSILEKETHEKTQKINDLQQQSLIISQKEKALKDKEANLDLEMKQRLLVEEEKIRKEAERIAMVKAEVAFGQKESDLKRQQESVELAVRKSALEQVEKVREEERLKHAELQRKLDDQTRMANEMKRKAEQGSMQLQGEVQELVIEEHLTNAFPKDDVEEISKGVKGGDCIHIVKDDFGNESGRIMYESKRTKTFSKEWITKLKDDMRVKQASIGVIVTEAMPGELTRFGLMDGIWICSLAEFKSVSVLLRHTMIRIGEVVASQDNKGDKMKLLYDYLTGNEFNQRVDAIREAFEQMNSDLLKERSQALTNFAKREKQIFKVMENTVALYGDVRGIAGGAIQSIKSLEISGNQQLQQAS